VCIFLVEDDIDDQELLEDAIRSINPSINLVSFMYGRIFIEELEQTAPENLPQLIILDYNIPELNGLDLLRFLKENNRYQAITKVIWSTSSSEQFRTDCLALGAKDYIVKPSSFAEMNVLAHTFLSFCAGMNPR
jgi:DNA-binding response OmpR family regulator